MTALRRLGRVMLYSLPLFILARISDFVLKLLDDRIVGSANRYIDQRGGFIVPPLARTLRFFATHPLWFTAGVGLFIVAIFLIEEVIARRWPRTTQESEKKMTLESFKTAALATVLLFFLLWGGVYMFVSRAPAANTSVASASQPPAPIAKAPEPSNRASAPKPRQAQPKTAASAPVTQSTQPPQPTSAPPAPSQNPPPASNPLPATTNNCPNGICISGGTVYHPEVHNFGPPLPRVVGLSEQVLPSVPPFTIPPGQDRMTAAIRYNGSLGFERDYLSMSGDPDRGLTPGLRVRFAVDSSFVNPQFTVTCDRPCAETSVSTGQTSADGTSTREIEGMPAVLVPGEFLDITFRSAAGQPITHVDITPKN
jgi:hypothetical protein